MTHRNMPIIAPNCPISQREYEKGSCVDLNQCDRLNASCVFVRLFAIYSILAVTLFQPRTIGFFDCVLLHLGIALRIDRRYLLKFAWVE